MSYTVESLQNELQSMLESGTIDLSYMIVTPTENGEEDYARVADYSDEYEEFNIEPGNQLEPLTVRGLMDTLEESLDNHLVYVWDIEGGKMVQMSSIGIHSKSSHIRIL